jgi:hypothetical protein
MGSSVIGRAGSDSVSPVEASRIPMAQTMSPAEALSMRSRRLACTWSRRATFSFLPVRAL